MSLFNLLPIMGSRSNPIIASGTVAQNIASGTMVPGTGSASGNWFTSGANPQVNCRTSHFNESGIPLTSLALIYGGYAITTVAEAICPNNYTITASIEYPAGTFKQVTWSASTSGVVTAGINLISDYVNVSIPANTQFWVRTYGVAAGGGIFPVSGASLNTTMGDLGEQAASGLADKTLGGTISGSVNTLRPAAILSNVPSNFQSWCGLGDSIMNGTGFPNYDSHTNIGSFGFAATGLVPWIQGAVGGTEAHPQTVANAMQYRLDLLKKAGVTHVIVEWGVNDMAFLINSSATIEADLNTIWTNISGNGQKVYQTTITPATNSTDTFMTVANQTAYSTDFVGGASSVYGIVNAFIRTAPSPLSGYIEVSSAVESSLNAATWGCGSTFNSNLAPLDFLTVSAGATTTSIPTNSIRTTSYYPTFTALVFTSGVDSGVRKVMSSYNSTGGTFIVAALSSAPSAGDTVTVYPYGVQGTIDGFHPFRSNPNIPLGVNGGSQIVINVVQSFINMINPRIFPSFNPKQISGCQLWLEGDDFTTIEESGTSSVIYWRDKSGNSNDAAANISNGIGPYTGLATLNGENSITFNTGVFALPSSLVSLFSGPYTVFCVLQANNTGDATQVIFQGYTSSIGSSLCGMQFTTTNLQVQNRSSASSFTNQALTRSNSIVCVGYHRSGTEITPFINGVAGTPGSNAQDNTTASTIVIGSYPSPGATRLNGQISDLIIYNSELSTSQMNQVGNYLANMRGFNWTNM